MLPSIGKVRKGYVATNSISRLSATENSEDEQSDQQDHKYVQKRLKARKRVKTKNRNDQKCEKVYLKQNDLIEQMIAQTG